MPASAYYRHVDWRARLWTMLNMAVVSSTHGKCHPATHLLGVAQGMLCQWLGELDGGTIETIRDAHHRSWQHRMHIADCSQGWNATRS